MIQRNRPVAAATQARIFAARGAVMLPVSTPYEWQVFGEHVSATARHCGPVRVRIGAVRCEARRGAADSVPQRCTHCDCRLTGVAFRMPSRDLCLDCTRRCVDGEVAQPFPAAL